MESKKAIILTGNIQSGKTTALQKWIAKRNGVAGVLTPVIEGTRKFYTISDGLVYQMEAGTTEVETQEVGRYRFSTAQFQKINSILKEKLAEDRWNYIIVDEIGPLELTQQKGLWPALEIILKGQFSSVCILVVRESLLAVMKAMLLENGLTVTVITANELEEV